MDIKKETQLIRERDRNVPALVSVPLVVKSVFVIIKEMGFENLHCTLFRAVCPPSKSNFFDPELLSLYT